MNRKNFLSTAFPFLASLPVFGKSMKQDTDYTLEEESAPLIPPYLKKGDWIGITAPAGFITREEIQPAIDQLTAWGYQVKLGNTIGKRDFTFGGKDEERREDLQEMLDDKNIRALMCARGGYGLVRIIDQLDFKRFSQHPKWIIGFSDITVLHSHISRCCNIGTIHAKMCNGFPADWSLAEPVQKETIESIHRCLSGEKMSYQVLPNMNNRQGVATGLLIGGNLKMIETLAGSKSDMQTKNRILFVEDTGEYLYSIDRMFWNLERTGKLKDLKALVIGGFKVKKDDEGEEFGKSLEEIVMEKVKKYHYPVCFDFPVGHQKNNMAMKCAVLHRLTVQAEHVLLEEVSRY